MGGDLGPVSVFVSLHSTHHTAPVGRAPGPWSTWGHDTLPETGPRDGWQVNQGNVVGEGQTSRAWSGGRGQGRAGSVSLGLLEEAEQEELVVGFGEDDNTRASGRVF